MSEHYKVRPTFSLGDLKVISAALNDQLISLVQAGNTGYVLQEVVRIKAYCDSFKVPDNERTIELINASLKSAMPSKEISFGSRHVNVDPAYSPLDDESIDDNTRYELLKLKDDKSLTLEETKFRLEFGMKRDLAALAKTDIDESNL